MEPETCPFCEITAADPAPVALKRARPGDVVRVWPDALALVPLGPVVPGGHLLVLPRVHVTDAAADPIVAGATMTRAAALLADLNWYANVITSRGSAATQTVPHLHLHLVRRFRLDDVSLPWDVRA